MSELKTKPTDQSFAQFLDEIAEDKREDSRAIAKIMEEVTGTRPQMWGDSIVGFGRYHYAYANGKSAEWFLTGFAARKRNLTLYIMSGFEQFDAILARLGKHSLGKSCLYINRLADIEVSVLRELIEHSVAHMAASQASAHPELQPSGQEPEQMDPGRDLVT